ncbi:hypothetical protein CYG27_RS17955 [Vibrio parahaemolyticus]|nr:hypothetical protein [Vibrio parahaemolyticus]EHC9828316.1 hypothetical protein [Vibrio parahaemolyticus]EHD7154255.1 hypothetical protein [Vibrio parahaemolyticus]EHH1076255.1 hypothetical protein [Vibrio parahaemolyticus]EHH2507306.1 hypothetical protein [Vibrio parahaemolyticus]
MNNLPKAHRRCITKDYVGK